MKLQLIRPNFEWFKEELLHGYTTSLATHFAKYKLRQIQKTRMEHLWRVSFKITNDLFRREKLDLRSVDSAIIRIALTILNPKYLVSMGEWNKYDNEIYASPKDVCHKYRNLLYESITGCKSLLSWTEYNQFNRNIFLLKESFNITLIAT